MPLSALSKLIKEYEEGRLSSRQFLKKLSWYPYIPDYRVKLDTQRKLRKGFPEVIYSPGKSYQDIKSIVRNVIKLKIFPLIITKANNKLYQDLKQEFNDLSYAETARIIYIKNKYLRLKGKIIVISAGTSDIPIAEEASLTAELLGVKVERFYDVGSAGLHRVMDKINKFRKADCLIVVAGMDGVLPTIMGAVVSKPIIAVPTSVGYGANFKGLSALLTMLNSCSPGIGVVNIDNGFGAGYLASLIARK